MKRFVVASVCVFALVGVVLAEELQVTITGVKTDGNVTTISYVTKAKKGEEGKKGTAVLATNAKVIKGMFNKDDQKFVAGDAIEGGIKADMFKNATEEKGKGVNARLTIADDGADKGKVTQVMVTGGGKGKKGGGGQ